jgi:hypothetical protein
MRGRLEEIAFDGPLSARLNRNEAVRVHGPCPRRAAGAAPGAGDS